MTTTVLKQMLLQCALLAAVCFAFGVTGESANAQQPEGIETRVYSGGAPYQIICRPGSTTAFSVAPHIEKVDVVMPNCICEDSKEQIKNRALDMIRSGNANAGANARDVKSFSITGDGAVTKTYYCYSNTVTLQKN